MVSATGPLSDPKIPDDPGARHASPARSSTPPAGTTTTTCAASASPWSAPAPPRSRSCRPSSREVGAADALPAHPAVGDAARRPGHQRRRALAAPAAARSPRTARRGLLWGIRELQVRRSPSGPNELGLRRAARQAQHGAAPIKDPALRARLTPDYRIGCKRILLSSDYYPALAQPNVDVVASGLSEVRGSTLVAADGTEAEVDAIVFGTGFHVTDMPIADRVVGRGRADARRGAGRTACSRCAAPPPPASPTG